MIFLISYILFINIISYIMMYQDKQKATKREWRIPESTLWIIAYLGGSVGIWLGMKRFRHKTKHRSFKIGVPILVILHIIFYMYLLQELS
ncbi:DUF1294 domain-containing protein [Bacillus pinisoli]|uniref:DUF1294 domain-containing protein n=1 Tax=Bacillus pinisoli TaxID=2901866 RepID=UPI001FF32FF6|nr:DUF1294 domain-containing protein [Bacillus pinisoli]